MPGRHVKRKHPARKHDPPLTGLDRQHLDRGLIDRRAVRREDHVLAVRQHLGPPVAELALRRVDLADLARVSAALAYHPQPCVVRERVHELPVTAPAASGPVARSEVYGWAAFDGNFPKLPLARVREPTTVGRQERPAV